MKRVSCLAAAAALTVLLVGCTGGGDDKQAEPVLQSVAALDVYPGVAAQVIDALAEAYPEVTWTPPEERESRVVSTDDEGCVLLVGPIGGTPSLLGEAGSWSRIAETVAPVLESNDFAPIEGEDELEGGWTGVRTTDETGAVLRLYDKGGVELTLRVRVTDPTC
ncbi:hypothetical protein [Herbiconiux liukaitaii]|uniref:hypothetical protein n=1 Tax=Herbiconiux liukaitaii TaxID=3342799 RepID=UPI0035BA8F80